MWPVAGLGGCPPRRPPARFAAHGPASSSDVIEHVSGVPLRKAHGLAEESERLVSASRARMTSSALRWHPGNHRLLDARVPPWTCT
jgi:hypothetical protein